MLKPENDTGKRARMICRNNLFEPNIILEMDQSDDFLQHHLRPAWGSLLSEISCSQSTSYL